MQVRSSKTKLFLIELIIIILFFAISGAVCMSIFAKAKTLSVESTEITMASMTAQSAIEVFRSSDGVNDRMADTYQEEDGVFVVYFDQDWNEVETSKDAVYHMEIGIVEKDHMATAEVTVKRSENVLYNISTKRYMGK